MEDQDEVSVSWGKLTICILILIGVAVLIYFLASGNKVDIPQDSTSNIDEQGNVIYDNQSIEPSDEMADEITGQVIGDASSTVTINILPAQSGETQNE